AVWGSIEKWKEGGGVRVLTKDQLKVVDGSAMNFADSKPEWMTAPLPVKTLVDSPKYLAWKKFPAGTTVTYETRLLHEHETGSNLYTRTKISVNIFRLDSIDEKRAVVMVSSTVWHLGENPRPSPETKLVFAAKVSPEELQQEKVSESGDETIEISGKKYATRWNSVWRKHIGTDPDFDPQTFKKTWTSEDVPSGIVLQHEQTHREILEGKDYRDINETILMPAPNVEPELGNWSAYKVAQGAPGSSARQVERPVNTMPAAGAVNRPQTGTPQQMPNASTKGAAVGTANPAPVQTQTAPVNPRTRQQPPTQVPAVGSTPEVAFAQHYSSVM